MYVNCSGIHTLVFHSGGIIDDVKCAENGNLRIKKGKEMNTYKVTLFVRELGLSPIFEYKSDLPLEKYRETWRKPPLGKVIKIEQIG